MTDTQKISRTLLVTNKAGFHLRVASMISQTAMKYQSDVSLTKGSYRADCKSCLDLLAVMAPTGTPLTLCAEGPDASEIAGIITEMFRTKFGEDEFAPAKN